MSSRIIKKEWNGLENISPSLHRNMVDIRIYLVGAKIRLYTTVVSMNEQNVVKRNKLLGLYDSLFDQ